MKPWHDTPHCACGGPLVPACDGPRNPLTTLDPSDVKCAACGKAHTEEDLRTLLRVWWSAGAWEGREETEREYQPLPPRLAVILESGIRQGAAREPKRLPRDVIDEMASHGLIAHERCALLTLEQWCDEGRYDYGVSLDTGWMVDR